LEKVEPNHPPLEKVQRDWRCGAKSYTFGKGRKRIGRAKSSTFGKGGAKYKPNNK